MSLFQGINNYKNFEELIYRACTEQTSGNDLLYVRKFGKTGALSAGSTEDIWEDGGVKTMPETTAATVSIVSTSANDALGGTGCNIVKISGLDSDYNFQSELINMNGLSAVTSVNSYITINRALCAFAGSGGKNAGAITGTISGNEQFVIPANESITQQSHFTVPAGYTCLTMDLVLSIFRTSGSGARRGEVDQMTYSPLANTTYQSLKYGLSNDGGVFRSAPKILSQTPEKHTLWFQATADANNTAFTSSVGYLLIRGNLNFVDF